MGHSQLNTQFPPGRTCQSNVGLLLAQTPRAEHVPFRNAKVDTCLIGHCCAVRVRSGRETALGDRVAGDNVSDVWVGLGRRCSYEKHPT